MSLSGKRILITRAQEQALHTAQDVKTMGGVPEIFACLEREYVCPTIWGAVAEMNDKGEHVLFTSANGVHAVAAALGDTFPSRFLLHTIYSVGDVTSKALQAHGLQAAFVANDASQQGVLDMLMQQGIPARLWFFRAEAANSLLTTQLRQHGCDVRNVVSYRMRCPIDDATTMRQMLAHGDIDAVLLGSTLTMRYYMQRIGDVAAANRPVIVSISDAVTLEAEKLGLDVQVTAKQASFAAMLQALSTYYQD